MNQTDRDLRAMSADRVRRARSKINADDTCSECRVCADTWYRNLPRTDCEWPGTFPVSLSPKVVFAGPTGELVVGPLAFKANPRMDIRTPNWQKVADWDVNNYEQIAHVFNVCRAHEHVARVLDREVA